MSRRYKAKAIIAPSKAEIGQVLSQPVVKACQLALASRDVFTIALSGGSLPNFLQCLPGAFKTAGVDPQWHMWHVLLADERCVPSTDGDSNLLAIREFFTEHVAIPKEQVYGIDETLLKSGSRAVASAYQNTVESLLQKSGDMLDCVVLVSWKSNIWSSILSFDLCLMFCPKGFGPDGHTCSLFPNHALLEEQSVLVANIDDSPKPPPSRITLTFPVLNSLSRSVIFCGAGESKGPILEAVFGNGTATTDNEIECAGAQAFILELIDPPPYPCAMVRPNRESSLTWVVDADAADQSIIMKRVANYLSV